VYTQDIAFVMYNVGK